MSLKPQEEMIIKNVKSGSGRVLTKTAAAALLTAAAALLCGCSDISGREFVYPELPEETTAPPSTEAAGAELLIITENTTAAETEDVEIPEEMASFSTEQQKFISESYFMGDSICLGLGLNGFAAHCSAKAGVAARNIEEFTFDFGGSEVGALTALVNSNLKSFVFLMGSNDVNVESDSEFVRFYNSFLSKVEALCPDASIYVLSIPPVTEDSIFCYNYQIDNFNLALKEMITSHESTKRHYIDIASYLKDGQGSLRSEYASDNTVHITKSAYYALLEGLCKEAGIK